MERGGESLCAVWCVQVSLWLEIGSAERVRGIRRQWDCEKGTPTGPPPDESQGLTWAVRGSDSTAAGPGPPRTVPCGEVCRTATPLISGGRGAWREELRCGSLTFRVMMRYCKGSQASGNMGWGGSEPWLAGREV